MTGAIYRAPELIAAEEGGAAYVLETELHSYSTLPTTYQALS